VFVLFGAVLYFGDDTVRSLTAAVTAILAAAVMIMVADSPVVEAAGDRAFWLSIGSALIIRATAASLSAIAFADHSLSTDEQALALGLCGLGSLILTAVLIMSAIPRGRSSPLLLLDAALMAIAASAVYAIVLELVGPMSAVPNYHFAVSMAAIGLDSVALFVIGVATVPFLRSSAAARWLVAGWALVVLADYEGALAFTAKDVSVSSVFLLSSLGAFVLGVAGSFRITTDPTSFSRANIRNSSTHVTKLQRIGNLTVAVAGVSFVIMLLVVGIRDNLPDPTWLAVIAAAGILLSVLSLAFYTTGQSNEMIELRLRHNELERQAMTDSVTELPNHRALMSRLNEEVERAKRFRQPLSVCFIDVDAFKQINDTYGHQSGDEVLKKIGAMVRANARQIDIVGRYGGEEFVILLPGTWTDDALQFGDRIREGIATSVIRPEEEVEVRLSVSIGVAGLPEHAEDRESLLKRADDAVYIAKRSGRNQVQIYNPDIELGTNVGLTMEDALRLVELVELRQTMSRGHGEEVARVAALMARRLGLDVREVERIHQAGLLHDLGKISVPDSVLSKDGPLSSRETELVRGHPLIGSRLLDANPALVTVSAAVRHHHERWDGTGYPYRLAGENIPLAARILALSEAYVAMTARSPWKAGRLPQEALAEISIMSGRQFDPKLVGLLAQAVNAAAPA
jgi:diguanylate cyclase (GGDEF)-like protein